MERFAAEQALANPGTVAEGAGEFYKSQGNFLFQDPWGPFGYGGYRILPARPPWWTELQRTFSPLHHRNTVGKIDLVLERRSPHRRERTSGGQCRVGDQRPVVVGTRSTCLADYRERKAEGEIP